MKVLVTNDDGIQAQGIKVLCDMLCIDHDVSVIAPDVERSAVSHGLTIHNPLFVNEVNINNLKGYSVSGTPADCVKLGIDKLVNSRPDIVVSGINKGANTGINVFYSGTVAAAMEATFAGIPAIAVSVSSFKPRDYRVSASFVSKLIKSIQIKGFPEHIMLNINVPNLPVSEIKGARITRQSFSMFKDCYESRISPGGTSYYWLNGDYPAIRPSVDFDEGALLEGWISVTPLKSDFNVRVDKTEGFEKWIQTLSLPQKSCMQF